MIIKILRQADGNAMIEVSLILPIIILMLLSVLDLGIVLEQYIAVADSARAGAEYAAITSHAADVAGMQTVATKAAGSIPGYQPVATSFCTCTPGGTPGSCTASCSGGVMPVQYAQVTATANLPLPFKVQGLPGTIAIKSVSRIRTAWTGGQ